MSDITYEDAINLLRNDSQSLSVQDLKNLALETSPIPKIFDTATGSEIKPQANAFNSGYLNSKISAVDGVRDVSNYVKSVEDNRLIANINDTDAGFLINGPNRRLYQGALAQKIAEEIPDLNPDQVKAEVDRIINDELFPEISARYAASVEGPVLIIAPGINKDGILAQREIPELLNNEKVTTINGVERLEWQAKYQTAFDQAKAQGLDNVAATDAAKISIAESISEHSRTYGLRGLDLDIDPKDGRLLDIAADADFLRDVKGAQPVIINSPAGELKSASSVIESFDDVKAKLDLSKIDIKGGLAVDLGIATVIGAGLIVTGSTPAEAWDVVEPDSVKIVEEVSEGDYVQAAEIAYVATAGGLGFWGGATAGATIGAAFGGVGAVPGFFIGAGTGLLGGTGAAVGAQRVLDQSLHGEEYKPATTNWNSISAEQAEFKSDPEIKGLQETGHDADKQARYRGLKPADDLTIVKGSLENNPVIAGNIAGYAPADISNALGISGPDRDLNITLDDLKLEATEEYARVAIPLDNMRKGFHVDPIEKRDMLATFQNPAVGQKVIDLADKRYPDEMNDLRIEAQERSRQLEFQRQYDLQQSMRPNTGIPLDTLDPMQRAMRGPSMGMGVSGIAGM